MKYIIIDDEPDAIDVLKYHLNNVPFMELIASFRNPIEALEYLQKNTVDLLFLDINMPKLSGINFAKLLEHPPLIIFTTAYSEYAIESYDLKAVDYLLKPIEFNRLLKAVMKAQDLISLNKTKANSVQQNTTERKDDTILLKSGSEFHQIPLHEIKYIESDGNYVTIHTTKRSVLARYKISEIKELLPQQYFVRVHRSYIVALKHIEIIRRYCVIIDNKEIPLSSKYRDDFFSIIDKMN